MLIIKNNEIVLRKCGSFTFLVNPRVSYNRNNEEVLQINGTGVFIWDLINNEITFEEVICSLIDSIDGEVDREELKRDVLGYLKELENNSCVFLYNQREVNHNGENRKSWKIKIIR